MVGSNHRSPRSKTLRSTNQGVDANLSDSDSTETSCLCSTSTPAQLGSLTHVRQELQTVLDLMGNSTPQLTNVNTSSDADNEESLLSSADPPSSKDLSTEVSVNRKSEPTYDSSKNTSKNTEHNHVNNKDEQSSCTCAKCIHTEMHMKGFMVSVPVQVPNPMPCVTKQPPTTTTQSVQCAAVHTERKCPCVENYGYAPCAQVQRLSRAQTPRKRSFLEWVKNSYYDKRSGRQNPCKLYKVNIEEAEEEGSPPRRLVFDMIDGIPKPETGTVATNTAQITTEISAMKPQTCRSKYEAYSERSCDFSTIDNHKNYKNERNSKEKKKNGKFFPSNIHMAKRCQETSYFDSQGDTRVDFYYFDHGNAQYLHTTDAAPVLYCEVLAEKTEQTTTRFWAEIFTTMHIATSFIISFFLQFFKFLLYSILRPVMVGGIQLLSDYLVKPFLTTLFNGIIQPLMIFLYNIATSFRDLCDPLAEGLGYFCKAIAQVFRAIRLVTVRKQNQNPSARCQMR